MKAAIITIGDEILIGQIVDTNSSWMAQKMTSTGFEIAEKIAIGDNATQIKNTIDDVFKRVDVILMTGGLGPTKDDITKKTLCEYFGSQLIFDESVLENIQKLILNRFAFNELTRAQAYVPENCTVIQNRVGTAPIMWFEHQGKILVSMPGIPYEMRYVMENDIVPRLLEQFKTESYLKKVYLVTGFPESALSIHLNDFEDSLPEGFGLAYLPSFRLIKLRLYVKGAHRQSELEEQAAKLESLLADHILSNKDVLLEKLLGERLFEKGFTLSTAESCTGGNLAHLITSVSGASAYYKGTIVSYSNEIKESLLNVPAHILEKHGAVSEEVVTLLVRNVQSLLNSTCSIAISGIAGPSGGTDEKPVGTVWIATAVNEKIVTRQYLMGKYRESNISVASNLAIIQMLEMLN